MELKTGTKAKKHSLVSFDNNKTLRVGDTAIKVGIEDKENLRVKKFLQLLRSVVRASHAHHIQYLAIDWKDVKNYWPKDKSSTELQAERVATELLLANYTFTSYKTKPKTGWPTVREVVITNVPKKDLPVFQASFKRAEVVVDEINKARDLANTPGSDMPPKKLAAAAKNAIKGLKHTSVKSLGRAEMKKLKMGAILGVGQGSAHEPQLIVLEYKGGKKNEKPIVLVGKGITYDTGGLGIKPAEFMMGMHMDMTGGALVIHTLALAARLKIKRNIVAIVAAAENAVGENSYRMGDVLHSMSGKTIEVRHTDAEGRLVLADALTYAQKKYDPKFIIDVATLTGAALVAIGQAASVVFSRDEKLAWDICASGAAVGDYVWPLPLWDDFKPELESKIADISNLGKTRWGSSINGGMFLAEFVDAKQPWIHLDIAPRMEATEADQLADGATGEPMRLLLKLTEEYGT